MKCYPSIDLGECNGCEGCVEIAPDIFQTNTSTGLIEVIACNEYPKELVEEAIKNCPKDCICWEIL